MTPGKVILGLVLLVVTAQLGSWGWQNWQLTQPGFHEADCWFSKQITGDTTCGYMVVQENRQASPSRTIRLPVVIFEAVQEKSWHYKPPAEPILYLTGGPGGQAYIGEQDHIDAWWFERNRFPKGHNLIVMGQRGTGLKKPDFDCEEFDTLAISIGAHPRGTPPPDGRALAIEAARTCVERLQAEGIDLTAYNSRESAADVAELRQALGIEAWNLYGVSYGTRLVLSVLRYHPEGVRAVILDSVYPPEAANLIDRAAFFRAALHRYLTGCDDASACKPPHDRMWKVYLSVREQLSRDPLTIDLSAIDPKTHLVVTIDEKKFDELLFQALYSRKTRDLIQQAFHGVVENDRADGNGETQGRNLLQQTLEGLTKGSDAVSLSHICHDEAPFESTEAVAAAARLAGPFDHLITGDSSAYLCQLWPSGSSAAIENTPVESDVPALLLVGSYDPVTPAALTRSAAAHLPNGHVFEFPRAGHGILYEVDCIDDLLTEFIADPTRRPKNKCRD